MVEVQGEEQHKVFIKISVRIFLIPAILEFLLSCLRKKKQQLKPKSTGNKETMQLIKTLSFEFRCDIDFNSQTHVIF